MKSEFLNDLDKRGLIHQATDVEALDKLLTRETVTGYIGFDATADSLHVGSLLQIMLLRRLQQFGHRPIVLMGGGTTKIGDPTFKDTARVMMEKADIVRNINAIKEIFNTYLQNPIVVDNADWLDELKYMDFLQAYGRHFTINRMLTFDSVKLRLEREQPLTFLEFNYMILQGYDFLELRQKYDCKLQLGGSDQWGNIINGVELTRRVVQQEVFGLTSPLITTADGGKMGKTAQGAVWLNKDKLSDFDFWQYWRNTHDADVGRFMRYFTDLPFAEIERLEKLAGSEINEAKKILANEVTKMARGEEAVTDANKIAKDLFENKSLEDLYGLPTIKINQDTSLVDLLVATGLATSKGEARRLIRGGGAKVDDQKVEDENYVVQLSGQQQIKLSAGKKHHALVTYKATTS